MTGYELGVECLLEQRIGPSQIDLDLAHTHHPELLRILKGKPTHRSPEEKKGSLEVVPMSPHQVPEQQAAVFEEVCPGEFPMPKEPFTSEAQNDFGLRIDRLTLARDITDRELKEFHSKGEVFDIRTTDLTLNMQELAALLGFELDLTKHFYFLRDHFIPQKDVGYISGTSGMPTDCGGASSEQIKEALEEKFALGHMKIAGN